MRRIPAPPHVPRPAPHRARRPAPRPGRVLAALVLLLALVPAGACCPPVVQRWDTPEATLANWQAHLCRDDVQAEYGCLAASFQARMRGFDNYYAARAQLLRDEPAAAWLLAHADLEDAAAPAVYAPDGRHARIELAARGETVAVDFECEAWVTVTYADGSTHVARQRGAPAALVGTGRGSQWIAFDRPPLDEQRLQEVRAIHVDPRWLIADLAGLAARSTTAAATTAGAAAPLP
jgi:hypothetical protein